jgi:hypothetical protein
MFAVSRLYHVLKNLRPEYRFLTDDKLPKLVSFEEEELVERRSPPFREKLSVHNSPETLSNSRYNAQIDISSLGMFLSWMVGQETLFGKISSDQMIP